MEENIILLHQMPFSYVHFGTFEKVGVFCKKVGVEFTGNMTKTSLSQLLREFWQCTRGTPQLNFARAVRL